MKHPDDRLSLPLYVKSSDPMTWPEDPVFYVLSRTGLFLCRNHRFFRSSVPARTWPAELAAHEPSLTLRYPRIPRRQIERVVGFFSRVAELHRSEAAVLFLWDARAGRLDVHVPVQTASVSRTWLGRRYPVDVRYEVPLDLPEHVTVVGDAHSHVDEPAYASATDRSDEYHRAGLHVVVGKLYREPPELHCEVVVDGTRFGVDPAEVIERYVARCESVPQDWIDRVTVEVLEPVSTTPRRAVPADHRTQGRYAGYGYGGHAGSQWGERAGHDDRPAAGGGYDGPRGCAGDRRDEGGEDDHGLGASGAGSRAPAGDAARRRDRSSAGRWWGGPP